MTFTPNTITYAIPVDSDMGKKVMRSKIGIVFHTTYSGPSISEMSTSFGVDVKPYQGHDDMAVFSSDFDDASGVALFYPRTSKIPVDDQPSKGSIKKSSPFWTFLVRLVQENTSYLCCSNSFSTVLFDKVSQLPMSNK